MTNQKISNNLLSNPNGGFWTFEVQKIWNMSKCQKIGKKMAKNIKNMLKFVMLKILQDIPFNF